MSAAIAMAPSPAPHDRPSLPSERPAPSATAPTSTSPSAARTSSAAEHQRGSKSPRGSGSTAAKSSPPSASRNASGMPKIFVKKEPRSPDLPAARHRPRKLDLSKGGSTNASASSGNRPLTARDSLGIQDVGLACLSPGFVTQDPLMKEQLQRSMSVREQQRHIIEARLQQQSAKGDGPSHKDHPNFTAKTPGLSRRNKAPPGLSIVAPSHEQFASERVIQSAPLNQTFTGMNNAQPLTRHIANQPSRLSNTSHIHHVPATQTNNRLPPIGDVFGQGLPPPPDSATHSLYPGSARAPLASPGHPPPPPPPPGPASARPRDYKSAEEAQAEMAAGRPELLPKLVHYGGHQPPTPPSPHTGSRTTDTSRSSKRRTRAEYEEGVSPPLGNGPAPRRGGPFGYGRDSPHTQEKKREEFLQLCERAWDLFHS